MTRTSVVLWVDEGVVGEQGKTKHYRKAETAKSFLWTRGETGSTRYLEVVVLRRGGSNPLGSTIFYGCIEIRSMVYRLQLEQLFLCGFEPRMHPPFPWECVSKR